ncbi:MAG: MFS transporter [Verrucomicrobiales bacterium]|jgi:MFS family permease|nr:MFS transporter [Verrucomicrobiales bacterium]
MNATTEANGAVATPNRYAVGTLKYDKRAIVILFGWLLWGDFAFNFFESVFGRFMPLYLKELNASNVFIGITTGSVAGLVNILFLPNISQWSDRLRARLGRRIPFLLIVTPLTTLSLLAIGFAPEIGALTHRYLPSFSWLTQTGLVLSLLCLFTIAFHFFNMILVNVFNWLVRDVVPQVLMARFLTWFRVVGTVAAMLFLWYVFPTMLFHRKLTFLLVGFFYLAAFLLMCWKVKEGDYPAPESRGSADNFLRRFVTYFRDCLGIPLYRNFFLVHVLFVIGNVCANYSFLTLYARHTLRLEMEAMGQIYAYAALLSAVVYIPIGWLCGKIGEMKVTLASLVTLVIVAILAYYLVTDQTSWLVYSLVSSLPAVGWTLGSLTVSMRLFPEKSFGQFASGINVFSCGGMIAGNYICGEYMDFVDSNYRLIFWWVAGFCTLAIVPMVAVYRGWRQHGGPDHYVAPSPIRK